MSRAPSLRDDLAALALLVAVLAIVAVSWLYFRLRRWWRGR